MLNIISVVLIFWFFFLVITIFGFSFLHLLKFQFKFEDLTLTNILKSFGIGLAIFIPYATLITGFRLFNFFAIYLPIIIIDCLFISYIYFKKKETIDFRKGKERFYRSFYINRYYILILIIILLMQYLIQNYFISMYLAYPSSDPYWWAQHIIFLHKNGYIEYSRFGAHFSGILFIGATPITIATNFYDIFFS